MSVMGFWGKMWIGRGWLGGVSSIQVFLTLQSPLCDDPQLFYVRYSGSRTTWESA